MSLVVTFYVFKILVFLDLISDYIIAVGGLDPSSTYLGKTELFSYSNTWSAQSDYPFGAEHFINPFFIARHNHLRPEVSKVQKYIFLFHNRG